MRELFLIRHGEASAGLSLMDRDFALTAGGWRQAHALGKRLAAMGVRPKVIYASALTRARQTAEIVAAHVPAPVRVRRDLIEHGAEVFLLGGTIEEAARRFPECVSADGTPRTVQGRRRGVHDGFSVGGESVRALHARARAAWEDILRRHPGPGGQYLMVSHGSFLSALLTEVFAMPVRPIWNFQFGNAAFAHLSFHDEAGARWPAFVVDGPRVGSRERRPARRQRNGGSR